MNKAGFSLIEIIVALAIVGMMAGLGFYAFRYFDTAKASRTKGTLLTVKAAIDTYKATTNQYPSRLEDLINRPSNIKGWTGDYVGDENELQDAWGYELQYKLNAKGAAHPYELYSYGKQGESGPEKEQISVWDIA